MRFVINAGLCFATALGLFIIGAVVGTMTAAAHDVPWLEGEARAPQCQEALRIADRAYRSKAFYLYEARGWPAHMTSKPVLQPIDDIDLSGGDSVVADPDTFVIRDKSQGGQAFDYWQKDARNSVRLVLGEEALGWRGNMYSLYIVPEMLDAKAFEAARDTLDTALLESWQVPLVLRTAGGAYWAISTEAGGAYLANWSVLAVRRGVLKPICTVRFVEQETGVLGLLPPDVKALADSLDSTLGSGFEAGTLQPTAHLRYRSQQTWANVILRPWALSRKPYNSRCEVDAALKLWSRGGPQAKRVYRAIQRQYPAALRALAETYVVRFGKTSSEADSMAGRTLDIAFRSYFFFSHEQLAKQMQR